MAVLNFTKIAVLRVKLSTCILFLLFNNICIAQISQENFYGDDGLIYQFGIDTFKTESRYSGFHSINEIAKGTYRIIGDTLILEYISFENPTRADFSFIKKEPIRNTGITDSTGNGVTIQTRFKVTNDNNDPIVPSPIVILKNHEKKSIEGFVADSSGNVENIFIFGPFHGSFVFTSLANKELVIIADTLAGYKSTVWVTLPKRVQFWDYSGTKKYLIRNKGGNTIELRSLDGDKIVLLELKE